MLLRTLLIPAAAALSFVPAATASAEPSPQATLTFDATLELERTVEWQEPFRIRYKDCNGDHYLAARGEERWKMSGKGRMLATVAGGRVTWHMGDDWFEREPLTAKAHITRAWSHKSGTTGGWCGGGDEDPPKKNDCGGLIVPFTVDVVASAGGGALHLQETRGSSPRERYDFYQCTLLTPKGVAVGSLPRLPGKVAVAALKGKRPIVVGDKRSYGPDTVPIGEGVVRTTSARYAWKLTLKRRR